MTSSKIENLKKQLKSSFDEHRRGRIYFIKKFLEENKHLQDPIDSLLRSLPEKYKNRISWDEVESALKLIA